MESESIRTCVRCYAELPFAAFGNHPRGKNGLSPACKACEVERIQVRKHGITSREKTALADGQDGCAICGRIEPGRKGWVVDHDHGCCPGELSCAQCRRGILCQWCNAALGYAHDDASVLRRMADYIELRTILRTGSDADPPADSSLGSNVQNEQDEQDGLTKQSKTCANQDHCRSVRARPSKIRNEGMNR